MEELTTEISEIKVTVWQKFGLAVLAILATSLAWWLLPMFVDSKSETIKKQEETIASLKSTVEYYRAQRKLADSGLRAENRELKQENKQLKQENDSVRDLRFSDKTEGYERLIKVLENGKSSVVIKPKKR